jgi:hypothetical protein
MRLLRMALEPKDRLVLAAGCQHPWPCTGKPAIIFHDRGKIFTSERARQVLVDHLGIITEQAPPYCPSAKGTVEALFRWMTQRFERRLSNTSHGINDAQAAAQAGTITLEELERYFYRAIVDDYQQSWDGLRRQIRAVLWEEAVKVTGVPQYLGAPDDLKLLLMKAQNRKASSRAYRVHDQRQRAIRAREKGRQWDRQREEIHPSHVLKELGGLAPPENEGLRLAKAVPDPLKERNVEILPIRYRNREAER